MAIAKNPVNVMLGMNIRRYRLEAGITAEELAEVFGWQSNNIYAIERGVNSVRVDVLYHMAKLFNVPVSYLVPDNAKPRVKVGPSAKLPKRFYAPKRENSLPKFE